MLMISLKFSLIDFLGFRIIINGHTCNNLIAHTNLVIVYDLLFSGRSLRSNNPTPVNELWDKYKVSMQCDTII